jgi:hypothetical protein
LNTEQVLLYDFMMRWIVRHLATVIA